MKKVTGVIAHRILLNPRVDPEVMARNLPAGFTPKVVNGFAIGGICQVSLSRMSPRKERRASMSRDEMPTLG